MLRTVCKKSDRYAILTRVEAKSHKEALVAMIDHARALGYKPIKASCRSTHLPQTWEGAVEILDKAVANNKNT